MIIAAFMIGFVTFVQGIETYTPTLPAIFATMIVGHVIADGPLQVSFLGNFKNRFRSGTRILHRRNGVTVWPLAMSLHAGVHAAFVGAIAGSLVLGAAEFCAHFLIDYCKGLGWFGRNADQALHVFCKIIWIAAIVAGLR